MSAAGRLIIVCGLPGSGKTTLARSLERGLGAIRMAPDEWMQALGINLYDETQRARIEALQWSVSRRLLEIGNTVVIEWGTWARSERDALRIGARAVCAAVELRWPAAPADVLFERIRSRGVEDPPITRAALDRSVELFQAPDDEELALYDEPLDQRPSPEDATLATLRRFYARAVTATAGVTDARIVEAFATVRREEFLGRGPWQFKLAADGYLDSETDDPAVPYQNLVVGLIPERRLNNGQPSLHAASMGMAAPQRGDEVIHVGAGTGYYTAILAHLVGSDGRVFAYEIDPGLGRRATENLASNGSVSVRIESAVDSPLSPADVIYVSAGATHVPGTWLDALKVGGRLVMPLTPNERDGLGCMLLVTRQQRAAYEARIFSPAAFIPCIGARDDEQSRALAAALTSRSPDEVRSLRRGDTPDDTAWCIGKGWWLSTANVAP